jgi:hypothetical protein
MKTIRIVTCTISTAFFIAAVTILFLMRYIREIYKVYLSTLSMIYIPVYVFAALFYSCMLLTLYGIEKHGYLIEVEHTPIKNISFKEGIK